MMSYVICTRLSRELRDEIDRLPYQTNRAETVKQLIIMGLQSRHYYVRTGVKPNEICVICLFPEHSLVHLTPVDAQLDKELGIAT